MGQVTIPPTGVSDFLQAIMAAELALLMLDGQWVSAVLVGLVTS